MTVTNLRNSPRDVRLRVRLGGQDMGRYQPSRVDERSSITVERSSGNLYCGFALPAFGDVVLRVEDKHKA